MQFLLQKGSLQRNVFFMLLGNGSFAFSQWFQISLIAKYSSIDTLGYFTLTLSIISPIFMFTGLQLRTLIITDVESKIQFNTFFTLRIITSFVSLVLIIIIGIYIANDYLFPFLILLSFQKLLEGISELFNSKQQQQEKVEFLAQSLLLKGLAIVLSMWLGLVIAESLVVGLCLILVFYLFIIYFNDYRNYKNIYHEKVVFKGKKQDLYNIIILGLPLGIVLLIISLNANVSKYFLEIYSGTEKQAIFSAISYILVIGLFILDS
jgi:O-antigen/teichoic acid export membrane protein